MPKKLTTALVSSLAPVWFGFKMERPGRVTIAETYEKLPLGSNISLPRGFGPNRSTFLPSSSSVLETSVHVPTSSLADCATASSLGRKIPTISADAVTIAERMRFTALPFESRLAQLENLFHSRSPVEQKSVVLPNVAGTIPHILAQSALSPIRRNSFGLEKRPLPTTAVVQNEARRPRHDGCCRRAGATPPVDHVTCRCSRSVPPTVLSCPSYGVPPACGWRRGALDGAVGARGLTATRVIVARSSAPTTRPCPVAGGRTAKAGPARAPQVWPRLGSCRRARSTTAEARRDAGRCPSPSRRFHAARRLPRATLRGSPFAGGTA